jgi:Effector Associated Constant Component 1
VDLQICIDGGTAADYVELADYLNGSRDFRGQVRLVTGPPTEGKLDAGVIQMLTVAVGSGGLGVALSTSLNKWLENRRPDITAEVIVTPKHRIVRLHARNANTKALKVLHETLLDADER